MHVFGGGGVRPVAHDSLATLLNGSLVGGFAGNDSRVALPRLPVPPASAS